MYSNRIGLLIMSVEMVFMDENRKQYLFVVMVIIQFWVYDKIFTVLIFFMLKCDDLV